MLPITFVVPCKSRLDHLKLSLPRFLATGLSCIVVDYDCPEHSGDWATSSYPDAIKSGNLHVHRVEKRERFCKPTAYNLGMRSALALGASHVFFVDADTLVEPELGAWCGDHASETLFQVFELKPNKRDLYGGLLAPLRQLVACKGYDESFLGWGFEDKDMRLRLALQQKMKWEFIPANLATSIPHDDELRTRHYTIKDIRASSVGNLERMRRNVRRWTGQDIMELSNDTGLRQLIEMWT